MKYFVYVLASEKKKNWYYVGSTSDLKQRFKEHTLGKTQSTKGFRPLRIIYSEEYISREEAVNREKYLKSGFGREEKKNIMQNSGIV